MKQAYLISSVMPGIPCIYYGDETGMRGGSDPYNRAFFREDGEYTELIRGTPLLLQLYLFVLVLPNVFSGILHFSQFTWIAISLCFNSGAYVSEIIRSGIQSVDKGQTEAARSLGMNQSQTMMRVVMPQAIKNILPAIGNEFVSVIKETSMASTFFVGDLMTSYLKVKGATYLAFECLIIVAVIYFVLTFSLSKLIGIYERRLNKA